MSLPSNRTRGTHSQGAPSRDQCRQQRDGKDQPETTLAFPKVHENWVKDDEGGRHKCNGIKPDKALFHGGSGSLGRFCSGSPSRHCQTPGNRRLTDSAT